MLEQSFIRKTVWEMFYFTFSLSLVVASFFVLIGAKGHEAFDRLHDGPGPSSWELQNYIDGRNLSVIEMLFAVPAVILCIIGVRFLIKEDKRIVLLVISMIICVTSFVFLLLGFLEWGYFRGLVVNTTKALEYMQRNMN